MVKAAVIIVHVLAAWGLCGVTMVLGLALTTTENAILIHLAAAPVIGLVVSLVYFRFFAYTGPLATALIFLLTILCLDFFVAAMLIEKSFEMFGSFLGFWLPVGMIAFITWAVGVLVGNSRKNKLYS